MSFVQQNAPSNLHAEARHALKQAQRASKRGDLKEAERWSKTAERVVAAVEKLRALPEPAPAADEEALRAELRARLRRLADASFDIDHWQAERSEYETAVGKAAREGGPMPAPLTLRPGDDAYLEKIGRGEIKR